MVGFNFYMSASYKKETVLASLKAHLFLKYVVFSVSVSLQDLVSNTQQTPAKTGGPPPQ